MSVIAVTAGSLVGWRIHLLAFDWWPRSISLFETEMGWDLAKVKVNGGAIALGHPIRASGCRILVTLRHEMQRRNAKKGLASICIGGGMGVAMALQRD